MHDCVCVLQVYMPVACLSVSVFEFPDQRGRCRTIAQLRYAVATFGMSVRCILVENATRALAELTQWNNLA